jgi:ADP-dependent glucokinase
MPGTNVCVDLVAPAVDVLGPLLAASAPPAAPGDRAYLATPADVLAAFLHHAGAGAAGERSSAPGVLAPLAAAAGASPRAARLLGGNAALMARKMAAMGVAAVLGGRVGPSAAALLPPGVAPAGALAAEDEVHLILEYGKGESFAGGPPGGAPRANRFIVTSALPEEAPAEFARTLAAGAAAGARVAVLSGLHMLEPLPGPARREALAAIAEALAGGDAAARAAGAPPTPVHVELASMASPEFVGEVAGVVLPLAASLGFNEQEGAALFEAMGGRYGGTGGAPPAERGELTQQVPRVAAVASVLRFLFRRLPRLSRIHFHSLAHHVLAHKRGGPAGPWAAKGPAPAVAAGAVACSTQACDLPDWRAPPPGGDDAAFYTLCPSRLGVGDPEAGAGTTVVRRLTLAAPVAEWEWEESDGGAIAFALAPVPICAKPTRTVGLGDAVSAAALVVDVPPAAARAPRARGAERRTGEAAEGRGEL